MQLSLARGRAFAASFSTCTRQLQFIESMKPFDPQQFALGINRRTFLSRSAYGLGGLALASLLNPALARAVEKTASTSRGIINPLHFPQKEDRKSKRLKSTHALE